MIGPRSARQGFRLAMSNWRAEDDATPDEKCNLGVFHALGIIQHPEDQRVYSVVD